MTRSKVGSLSEEELLRLACEHVSDSIFHVKFENRDISLIRDRIVEIMNHLPNPDDEEELSDDDEEELSDDDEEEEKCETEKDKMLKRWGDKKKEMLQATPEEFTTGFVVGEEGSSLLILTCAHAFQACFNASYPLTITDVREMFKISVRCDHQELNHNGKAERQYTEATVYQIDTAKDMLLLRVRMRCTGKHPVLEIADSLPAGRLGGVGMVSWPFDRHRNTVRGNMSHGARMLLDFNDYNDHGYDFSAIEVNITSDGGSSGAPAVDTAARVIGMLHGSNVDCVTYFVSMVDIINRLTAWGVMNKKGGASGSKGKGKEVETSGSKNLKRKAS